MTDTGHDSAGEHLGDGDRHSGRCSGSSSVVAAGEVDALWNPALPMTMAGGVLILLTVALAASWIPARRAAGVEPMEELRVRIQQAIRPSRSRCPSASL
jgi:hypothetical protein